MSMRRSIAVILSLLLVVLPVTPVFADTLSIESWSTGSALSANNLNSRMTSITTWSTRIANDNILSTAAIVGSKLDLTSGTGRISHSTSVTSDAPVFTSAQTWNNAAGVFSLWRGTATNTNSASTSRLIDMRVGSTIIASLSRVGQLILAAQDYASGPTTLMEGAWFNLASATMTDNMTAASGTAPRFMAYAFQRPALAAANTSVTTTNAATVFIASAPVTSTNMTLTNRYALWVDQGDVRLGGAVFASGAATIDGRLETRGALWAQGDTSLDGAVTLGNAAADNITVTGTVTSNLIFTDNTYDIGASGATRPRNIYNSGILNVGTGGSPSGQVYVKSAAAGTIGLVVDTAASPTAATQVWQDNGSTIMRAFARYSQIFLDELNRGNNTEGPMLSVGYNTSAGAVGPAAGTLRLAQAAGTLAYVWADNTAGPGKLRVHTLAPTGSAGAPTVSDTAGTVVGDQTSWHEAKDILRQWDDPAKALAAVLATKIYDFRYKESSYLDADNQPAVFTGIVGFDRRDPFLKNVGRQQIPALNEVNGFGYLILSVQALQQQIDDLKARRD